MAKKAKKVQKRVGEVARQLMKERLAEHLRRVEEFIKKWLQELSVPQPFVRGGTFWPCRGAYTPSSEKDADKNHIIRRHLRSRSLWRIHSDWVRRVRGLEKLGLAIYEQAKKMRPESSQAYLEAGLWAAFERATGGRIKESYEVEEGKGVTFYGIVIDEAALPAEKDKVAQEHREMRRELAYCEDMAKFLEEWERIKILQKRMSEIVNKALLSSDIFYPCKFCKRLMEA